MQKAHAVGLNISKTCELALQKRIQLIEQSETHGQPVFGEAFSREKGSLVRLPGFEPGSSTWQADVLNQARLQPQAWTFFTLIQRGDFIFPYLLVKGTEPTLKIAI